MRYHFAPTMVNFINILRTHFSYESALRSFFLLTCNQRKAAEKTFIRKRHSENVDDIDTYTVSLCGIIYNRLFVLKLLITGFPSVNVVIYLFCKENYPHC